jgi:hypothetical protein
MVIQLIFRTFHEYNQGIMVKFKPSSNMDSSLMSMPLLNEIRLMQLSPSCNYLIHSTNYPM